MRWDERRAIRVRAKASFLIATGTVLLAALKTSTIAQLFFSISGKTAELAVVHYTMIS